MLMSVMEVVLMLVMEVMLMLVMEVMQTLLKEVFGGSDADVRNVDTVGKEMVLIPYSMKCHIMHPMIVEYTRVNDFHQPYLLLRSMCCGTTNTEENKQGYWNLNITITITYLFAAAMLAMYELAAARVAV